MIGLLKEALEALNEYKFIMAPSTGAIKGGWVFWIELKSLTEPNLKKDPIDEPPKTTH